MFFDTHAHLDDFSESQALSDVLDRARRAGVTKVLAIGADAEANRSAVAVARQFPAEVRAAVGYDRDQATGKPSIDELTALLDAPEVVALGEIGLDYHYHRDTAAAQQVLFRKMLELAAGRRLPVVVHSREADEDTLGALREHAGAWKGDADRIGVLHSFTGGIDFAKRLLDLGFHISFSGIVTFRNAGGLVEVARMVPDSRLLIETDTPYLAPVPHRGRPNEPAYVVHVAEALAKIRNDTPARIAHITAANAERLFGWHKDDEA